MSDRWMKEGDVTRRLAARYVELGGNGCWLWLNIWHPDGYAYYQKRKVHRRIFEMYRGPIPDGLELDHLCRNRACVNPAHLEPVTHAENMQRGWGWSGRNARKTHCPQGHPYSGDNLLLTPAGYRRCRTCVSAGKRRSRNGGAQPSERTCGFCGAQFRSTGNSKYCGPDCRTEVVRRQQFDRRRTRYVGGATQ